MSCGFDSESTRCNKKSNLNKKWCKQTKYCRKSAKGKRDSPKKKININMSDSFKVFNSLGKKKEVFYTNKKNQVSMYVCGPTVYDLLHVGNFRGHHQLSFLHIF